MAYYYSPFRKNYHNTLSARGDFCPFCDSENMQQQAVKNTKGQVIENEYYTWVVNYFPKFEGHTMVVPKKHTLFIGEENTNEVVARENLTVFAVNMLKKLYPESGVEVFIQTGQGSTSSVPHLHWHILPAHESDPLRAFEKLGHFSTVDENKEKVLIFPVEIKKALDGLQKELAETIGEDFPTPRGE